MKDKKLIKQFIISKLILIITIVICSIVQGINPLDIFSYYDNEWYLDIALHGYSEKATAFFPMVPLLIKLFSYIKIPIIGMIILNTILTYITGYLIYKMTKSYKCSCLWFLSPISIFCSLLYTESIFVFLTTLSIYLFREKNYKFLGLTIGLSVFTRNVGCILFFLIFVIMFINFLKKKEKFTNILLVFIPATIISILYPLFLQIQFGNCLLFVDVQYTLWNRESCNLFSIIIKDIDFFIHNNMFMFRLNIIINYLILGIIIYLIVKDIIKNRKLSLESVYLILSVLVINTTCRASINVPSTSFYRYYLGCCGVYLLFRNVSNKEYKVFVYIFLILNLIVSLAFCFSIFMC